MSLLLMAALVSADPTALPSAWDFEARIAKVEARLDSVEKKLSLCTCIQQAEANQTHPYLYNVGDTLNRPTGPAAAQYYSALGSQSVQYVQSCANGVCQMVPVNTAYGQSFAFSSDSGGSCANGSCASGSCGSSQSSGRRGLFGRRR